MSVDDLTHFSLFSGIGGIDLASEWAGFKTIGQCEQNEYCQKVLKKNFGELPLWSDIRDVTKESFWEKCGECELTLLSGGFPCQPFSYAGKRRGKEDDRYLWDEMFRVVSELQPTWVVGENVAGIVNMALDEILFNLESLGYKTRTFIIPVGAIGFYHRRYRTFVVANSNINRRIQGREQHTKNFAEIGDKKRDNRERMQSIFEWESRCDKSGVCRILYGVPNRVDRLRALGNAVVPQQVYPILKGIADIERGMIP